MLAALALVVLQDPAVPRSLGWDDFPVFVWREEHAGKPLPPELVEPFGGVILMRGEDSTWARERGLAYMVWNVAGRDIFHLDADEAWRARVERWIETKDEALLVRAPCLSDPKTLARAFTTFDATLAQHGEHPGLAFVLGDEVGLTPNGSPFDLCRCGFCEERWRAHAEPRKLPARAPLTDEVLADLEDDDVSTLGAWLARRRFDRREFEHSLLRVHERALGFPDPGPADPTADFSRWHPWPNKPGDRKYMALFGTRGITAFGGLDLATLGGIFRIVEPYPVNEAREALLAADHVANHDLAGRTGPPSQPLAFLTTVFLDEETPDGAAWKLWEHWLRGGGGAVLWSDKVLARSQDHFARLAAAVSDIRRLSELYRPLHHDGGALVFDADSASVSFLRDALEDGKTWPRRTAGYQVEHGTRDRKVQAWLRLIEDCGELPVALPLASVRAECAQEFRFLVLPEILVLDEGDVRRLEGFVAAGGTLILDGGFGWVDRQGKPWQEDLAARLLRNRTRVLRAPAHVKDYLEGRRDPESAAPLRAFLRPLLEGRPRTHPSRTAVLPALDPAYPWLVNRDMTWPQRQQPLTVIGFLPNLPSAAERAELQFIELPQVPEAEGLWLHPKPGEPLPPGDAAVFLPRRFLPQDKHRVPVPLGPYQEPEPK